MKQIVFSLLFLFATFTYSWGQTKEMNTAKNGFDAYIEYEKAEGKTEGLLKAQKNIDAAFDIIKTKQAANDPKVKVDDKTLGKAYHYKALIYTALAEAKLADNAVAGAIEGVTNSIKYDEKGIFKLEDKRCLDILYAGVYNQSVSDFKDKKYDGAFDGFEHAIALSELMNKTMATNVLDTSAIIMAAYSAQNGNKIDQAIKYYQIALKNEFKEEGVYKNLSEIYLSQGKQAEAGEVMNVGKKVFPNSNAFLIGEINYLLKEGKKQEALNKMEDAARLYPDNASLFVVLASTYEGMKTPETDKKAIENYKKAVELDGNYFDAVYNLAAYYYNKGADIINDANKLGLKEQQKYDALKKESENMFNTALPYFEKALSINPKDIGSLTALKGIYASLNNLTKSNEYKKLLDEALKGGK